MKSENDSKPRKKSKKSNKWFPLRHSKSLFQLSFLPHDNTYVKKKTKQRISISEWSVAESSKEDECKLTNFTFKPTIRRTLSDDGLSGASERENEGRTSTSDQTHTYNASEAIVLEENTRITSRSDRTSISNTDERQNKEGKSTSDETHTYNASEAIVLEENTRITSRSDRTSISNTDERQNKEGKSTSDETHTYSASEAFVLEENTRITSRSDRTSISNTDERQNKEGKLTSDETHTYNASEAFDLEENTRITSRSDRTSISNTDERQNKEGKSTSDQNLTNSFSEANFLGGQNNERISISDQSLTSKCNDETVFGNKNNKRKSISDQTLTNNSSQETNLLGKPNPENPEKVFTSNHTLTNFSETVFLGETKLAFDQTSIKSRKRKSISDMSSTMSISESSSSNGYDIFPEEESDNISDLPLNEIKHGLKHLSRSTPTMSPSGSPHHSDSEGPTHISRRTKKFLRRFRNVPSTERVINYFACAIVSDILLQGTLYITDNYFAFYSNIFGYVNKTLIPIATVSNIQKEKTAKFIPNAVGLQTFDGKAFVFSSLISRDATYKFMVHMWRKSRKLTDSDIESTIPGSNSQQLHDYLPTYSLTNISQSISSTKRKIQVTHTEAKRQLNHVTEEVCLDESGSNSGDSAVEDCVDYVDADHLESSIASQNAISWSKSSPVIVPGAFSTETSVTYTENNSSNTTPETCISTASFNEFRNSVEILGTSASENETPAERKENICPKSSQSDIRNISDSEGNVQWIVKTKVVRSVVSIGVAPFRAVKEGLRDITFPRKKSLLLVMSSSLIFFLLLSAAFMIYRVEYLNDQLNSGSFHYGDLYEEVLHMQQKLHAATAKEIEKTLNHQIRQLVTVKQSLEALIFLLNTDHASPPSSHIQETTY